MSWRKGVAKGLVHAVDSGLAGVDLSRPVPIVRTIFQRKSEVSASVNSPKYSHQNGNLGAATITPAGCDMKVSQKMEKEEEVSLPMWKVFTTFHVVVHHLAVRGEGRAGASRIGQVEHNA
jgi:hypothetical protein